MLTEKYYDLLYVYFDPAVIIFPGDTECTICSL